MNCYDQILVELGALASMRFGLPSEAAKFMVEILKGMEHHVAIGDHISERCVETGVDKVFDGTGQGTGWAGRRYST